MDKITDINGNRFLNEVYGVCFYQTLFDLTQEVNVVMHTMKDFYKGKAKFARDMKQIIETDDLTGLALLLQVHGRNMQAIGEMIAKSLEPGQRDNIEVRKRIRETAEGFSSRRWEPMITHYLNECCDLLEDELRTNSEK